MAIAESGNAPLSITSATTTVTSGSFTPDANSLLVAVVAVGNSTGAGTQTGTVTDSLASTWSLLVRENVTTHGSAEVWLLDAGSAPAPRTVTLTGTVTTGKGLILSVKTLLGAKPVASQTGATSVLDGSNSSASITTTTTGSYVVGAASHSDTAFGPTPLNGTTFFTGFNDAGSGSTYATFKASALTGTPGATTLGLSNAAVSQWEVALAEILPAVLTFTPPVAKTVALRHRRR